MSSFLSVLAVLLGPAAAASLHSDGASVAASISQIRSTLSNLLRSIEDTGRDAEDVFGKRQLWCESSIHDFTTSEQSGRASLQQMQAHLSESLASAEESKGAVEQLHTDIESVNHTIKQTEDMLQKSVSTDAGKLRALAANKHLSLTSLQGELQVAVPVLAQLQASVAEMRQRISYRSESAAAATDFAAAVKDRCQKGADHADRQAAARVDESNSIHVALQALEAVSPSKKPSAEKDQDSSDLQASALSFVQRAEKNQEVTMDDLSDLFAPSNHQDPATVSSKGSALMQQQPMTNHVVASPLKPHIRTLLTDLKDTGISGDQANFCMTQRESSKMAVKFAQDSINQISSEVASHTSAEAELSDEVKKLQTFSAAVTDSAKVVVEQAKKDEALAQSSRKDQELAVKILGQAVTILRELGVSNTSKAVSGLVDANKIVETQVQLASDFQQQAAVKAHAIADSALALFQLQESEQHNLEFAREDHASQRLRAAENKRLYEDDAQEASEYVQKLEESCKADVQSQVAQQRSIQVHALEDADSALAGKLKASSNGNSLRGTGASSSKPKEAKNLTPMQRAAAEMGISTD